MDRLSPSLEWMLRERRSFCLFLFIVVTPVPRRLLGKRSAQWIYQRILNIHRFHICKFVYLLNVICNPQIHVHGTFAEVLEAVQNLNHLMCTSPAEVELGNALPSCFHSHTVAKGPFCGPFSATFFTFLCFLFVISPLKTELFLCFLALDVALEKSEGSLDFLPSFKEI